MADVRFTRRIGFRIAATVATLITFGVSLAAAAFILHDFNRTLEAERKRLIATASAFAAASSQPLAVNDIASIHGVIRGIANVEGSTLVSVQSLNGETLAEIGASVTLQRRTGEAAQQSNIALFSANSVAATAPILSNGRQIGSLRLHKDITPLRNRYLDTLILLICGTLSAALLISLAAFVAIGRALSPLRTMSRKLTEMQQDGALDARFELKRNDEVGVLANAFNNAFRAISDRDEALRAHRDNLEDTVRDRTRELQVAVEDARRANAAKSDFLATMSHEIRTPMNGMMVMAELLVASGLASRQQRFAEVITRSGNTLLSIINDILDMSKIEAGKLELEAVPFSLETLVQDTVSLHSARAAEKGLSLHAVISPKVANEFIGDPTRLGQIFSNLINNAIKFTDTGGITIDVNATDTGSSQALHIAVRDTGIGISEDKLGSIFEAFSQADQSTTRLYGGTGLGLSISKRLIDAMDAKISVESAVGRGTTFLVDIELPVHAPAQTLERAAHAHSAMVVEINPVARQAIERILTDAGLEITSHASRADLITCGNCNEPELREALQNAENAMVLQLSAAGETKRPGLHGKPPGIVNGPLDRSRLNAIIRSLNEGTWEPLEALEATGHAHPEYMNYSELRVLAVDDNAVNREVLKEALSAFKIDAVFADGGEKAVDLATSQAFDVILMDCSMPGMDGYQATAEIRASGLSKAAAIVALTAHVAGPQAERWQSAGMDAYIAKPFRVAQLAELFAKFSSASPDAKNEDPAASHSPDASDEEVALLSAQTLEMFDELAAANGADVKTGVFSMFTREVDDGLKTVLTAFEDRTDITRFRDVIHALKSMCSSSGPERARFKCEQIEGKAENGAWPRREEMDALIATIEKTKDAMRTHLQGPTEAVAVSI